MRDSAMPWRSRRMVLSSAGALRRNLSRAGVLKKRSCVSTAVPASAATSRRACTLPPSPRRRVPAVLPRAGAYLEAAHRADGGQRLAPEAQGGDGVEIGLVGDLRGGVALEREVEIDGAHAHPVIAHPDELTARILELDADGRGMGVDGVLHQLLHHGGGTLHDLSGGDLVDQELGKETDRAHG